MALQKFDFAIDEKIIITITSIKDDYNNTWFKGKEVAQYLHYGNTNRAIIEHVELVDKSTYSDLNINKKKKTFQPRTIFINEIGLCALIKNSKKPEAQLFEQWIDRVVKPSILRTIISPAMSHGSKNNTSLPHLMEIKEFLKLNIFETKQTQREIKQNQLEIKQNIDTLQENIQTLNKEQNMMKKKIAKVNNFEVILKRKIAEDKNNCKMQKYELDKQEKKIIELQATVQQLLKNTNQNHATKSTEIYNFEDPPPPPPPLLIKPGAVAIFRLPNETTDTLQYTINAGTEKYISDYKKGIIIAKIIVPNPHEIRGVLIKKMQQIYGYKITTFKNLITYKLWKYDDNLELSDEILMNYLLELQCEQIVL